MQTYVTQLVEYLEEAKHRKPAPFKGMDIIEEIIATEEATLEKNGSTMEAIFGVPKNYFPPADRLSDDQLTQLVAAIVDLWREFHYEAVLPENLPARYAYPVLVAQWHESHPLFRASNATWYIEFCNYEPSECPFPEEFCSCKRHLAEYKEFDFDGWDETETPPFDVHNKDLDKDSDISNVS